MPSMMAAAKRALEVSARDAARPISALVAQIDEERLRVPTPPNLASALRQWLSGRALEG